MPIPLAPYWLLLSVALCGCDSDQATPRPVAETQAAAPANISVDGTPVNVEDTTHGPDEGAIELAPDAFHGNWRLTAADDAFDQGLMAFSVQSSIGEPEGSGDFVLFQPFCDAVANAPIRGDTDCELIDLGATFDTVKTSSESIELVFHPTADGLAHRLRLHREGDQLVGVYVVDGDEMRRAVIARARPE